MNDPLDIIFVEGAPPQIRESDLNIIADALWQYAQDERQLLLDLKEWLGTIDDRLDHNTDEWRTNHRLYERVIDAIEASHLKTRNRAKRQSFPSPAKRG